MADPEQQFPAGSPEWWAYRLDRMLDQRQRSVEHFDRYYRGDHSLPHIPERQKYRTTLERLLRESRSNWMKLVVDVPVERLTLQGFHWAPDVAAEADLKMLERESWGFFEDNDLEVGAEQIHQESILQGVSYALVAPGDGGPLITPEHPGQAIVACSPENRRARLAGWKRWLDDSGLLFATLYLPGVVVKLQSDRKPEYGSKVRWVPRVSEGDDYEVSNPFESVPLVPFVNQPRMMAPFGVSDIDDLTDTQDRINETLFGRLVASQFAAFRQRYIIGMEVRRDPETGEPVKEFDPGASELWAIGNPNAKAGEFEATDLGPYIDSVESDIQHLAAQSRTPPHYLLGQSGAFPSGESLKSTETGLVAKVVQRQRYFTAPWREVMRLAHLAQGRELPVLPSIQWQDPEARTLGELTDSLQKMRALEVPLEVLWAKWGATPREVAEWQVMRASEAITASLADPSTQAELAAA